MKVLLDTHTFLWWILDDARLSLQARSILRDGRNALLLSAATGWEIAIKAGIKKIVLPGDPVRFVVDQMHRDGFRLSLMASRA